MLAGERRSCLQYTRQ